MATRTRVVRRTIRRGPVKATVQVRTQVRVTRKRR